MKGTAAVAFGNEASAQSVSIIVLKVHPAMVFFEILRQMLRTLWAHKLRSFLTMFGIAWGVGSLLLLVGLGRRLPLRKSP